MYALRSIPTKGLGLFATRPIPRGTRILSDTALLTLSPTSPTILSQAQSLPPASLSAFLALAPNPKKTSLLSWAEAVYHSTLSFSPWVPQTHLITNIFRNNNFFVEEGRQALFPEIARINHSCVPNSQGNWNESLRRFTVHAVRDVEAEEEITISYLEEQLGVRKERRRKLWESHGFECACEACGGGWTSGQNGLVRADGEEGVIGEGEKRRMEMRRMLREFGEQAERENDAEKEYRLMKSMIETYKHEGLRGREVASLCIAAAKKALLLGRPLEESAGLALRGLRLEAEAVGNDSPFFAAAQKAVKDMGIRIPVTAV